MGMFINDDFVFKIKNIFLVLKMSNQEYRESQDEGAEWLLVQGQVSAVTACDRDFGSVLT